MKGLSKAEGLLWPEEAVSSATQLKVKRGAIGRTSRKFCFCRSWFLGFREWGTGSEHTERGGWRKISILHPRRLRKAEWKQESFDRAFVISDFSGGHLSRERWPRQGWEVHMFSRFGTQCLFLWLSAERW